jgi:hypothetical protein
VIATPNNHVTYSQPNVTVDAAGRVAVSAFALADGRVDEVLLLSQGSGLHFDAPLNSDHHPLRSA